MLEYELINPAQLRSSDNGTTTGDIIVSQEYHSTPPNYPCIRGNLATSDNNLFSCYVDMLSTELLDSQDDLEGIDWMSRPFGQLLSLNLFYSTFGI